MTKVQYILKEINDLNSNELEMILVEIYKKVSQEKKIKSILNEYKGIGKGIWKIDAQKYIDQERNQDRA
ncbi:MAG TPA: hypothetical protein ENJ53_07400 [Phaeodactylibacter sp.]|nr:hypothetical protein [Phaeodactylibacter sp.]